jgi:hypothetical protein
LKQASVLAALVLSLGVVAAGVAPGASGQTPEVVVQGISDRPPAPKEMPSDFIDSRPILAYFDSAAIPDTVRGLLKELNRPDTCGEGARLRPQEACALVFYKLDDAFTPDRLRPPLIMRAIYRVTHPADLADTVLLMPERNGDLKRYADGALFEPLRDIRANICLQDKRMADQCRATQSNGVLYRPFGILGKLENDREEILSAGSAGKHFLLNLKPADDEWLKEQELRDLCAQHIICR